MSHPAEKSLIPTSTLIASKVSQHITQWASCENCNLCKTATWRVLGKGTLPCDILFIGEAPGNSENDLGKPFIGKAGKVLDTLIVDTRHYLKQTWKIRWDFTTAVTNVVGCIPTDGGATKHTQGYVFRTPTPDEIRACSKRLHEFTQLAAPRGIILLGATAAKYAKRATRDTVSGMFQGNRIPCVYEIAHPAHIVRAGGVVSSRYKTWLRETIYILRKVYEQHHGEKSSSQTS